MKIIFVCTGNTCRSPMATAFMKKIAADNDMGMIVESAGIMAAEGENASENAIGIMHEYGIDITEHRSYQLREKDVEEADLILTMTYGQKMMISQLAPEKVFTLGEFSGNDADISDPYGGDLEEYRETAEEIYDMMVDAAEKFADMMG